MMNATLCLAVALALSFEPLYNEGAAQGPIQGTPNVRQEVPRTPLVIAVVDPFPYGNASAVIVRRAGAPDLVAVRNDRVDAARLARAVRLTQVLRAVHGKIATQQTLVRVPESGEPTPYDAEAADWTVYLQEVSPRVVPGHNDLGPVRSLRLHVADEGFRVTQVPR